MIQAIPTTYSGITFRSRLEARWAVFWDALGADWRYEYEGYQTSHGWYLPDFTILGDPECNISIEGIEDGQCNRSNDWMKWQIQSGGLRFEVKPFVEDITESDKLRCLETQTILLPDGLPKSTDQFRIGVPIGDHWLAGQIHDCCGGRIYNGLRLAQKIRFPTLEVPRLPSWQELNFDRGDGWMQSITVDLINGRWTRAE